MKRIIASFNRAVEWLRNRLGKKQFLIVASILVGLTAGIAAVMLKTFVHLIRQLFSAHAETGVWLLLYLTLPMIGIGLCVLFIRFVLRKKLRKGSASILHSIARRNSNIPRHHMYAHMATSALTVGFGGSAGLESPIVSTGAAIGANFGKAHGLTYNERTLMLACGAAAGIGAVFNAPIAGLLFALEVLLADVTVSAFIPIMIAAATGTIISKVILNDSIPLSVTLIESFDYSTVHWFVLLGIISGLVSVYYSRVFPAIEKYFRRINRAAARVIIGGVMLAVLIWIFPSLFGEGYGSIQALTSSHPEKILENSLIGNFISSNWALLAFIAAVGMLKVFAVGVTLGAGGNGGNFAPSLFVGSYLGFVFGGLINEAGIARINSTHFTVAGMAGVLTGIFHAPLTGIFLIAEVTGGYDLFIPLMIVSALSYTVVKYFEPFSMDTKHLASKGRIFTQDKDRNILSKLKMEELIETNFESVKPEATLAELVKIITHSNRSIFPVLSADGQLKGIVHLDDIRSLMFRKELYDSIQVTTLMKHPSAVIVFEEDMFSIMRKFEETSAWNLPVIENDVYKGFISKSGIFSRYRKVLIGHTITHE